MSISISFYSLWKYLKITYKKICTIYIHFDFNNLEKNNSINFIYNGIAITIDMLENNPTKVRLFDLRSFEESLYHSITDTSLEFGYKSI